MRQLATIQSIADLQSIPGADAIQVATILGWQVVVKKEEFNIGDKVVYCEIDSILPDRPEFEFLRDRKFRIKTIRLRKQVSQGIAFPLSVLEPMIKRPLVTCAFGDDVTEVLGVTKYDPQAVQEAALEETYKRIAKNRFDKFLMRYKWWRKLTSPPKSRLPFPKWISKTDETRLQNMPSILQKEHPHVFCVTEKLDGQSATYFLLRTENWYRKVKYEFGVCSRNFQLLKEDDSSYWTIARQFKIKESMKELMQLNPDHLYIVLQGEIIGQRIQGNKYKIEGYDFYTFNVITRDYLNESRELFYTVASFGSTLTILPGIKCVPILDTHFTLKPTVFDMVEYSKGSSVLLKNQIREGVVVRCVNWSNEDGGVKPLQQQLTSFKVINPDFLLKCEE